MSDLKHDPDLFEATKSFWNAFYIKDDEGLDNLLSPDCRMQNDYGDSSRGINGSESCLKKLNEIQSKVSGFETGTTKLHFKVMKSKCQTRFLICVEVEELQFNVGFILEWEYGIIVGIVVVNDAINKGFLRNRKSGNAAISFNKDYISPSQMGMFKMKSTMSSSHERWRKILISHVSAVVIPKNALDSGGDDVQFETEEYNGSDTFIFMKDKNESEKSLQIRLSDVLELHEDSNGELPSSITNNTTNNNPHPSKYESNLDIEEISVAVMIDDEEDAALISNNHSIEVTRYCRVTDVILIPDRVEMLNNCNDLFYTAIDYRAFNIDAMEEIRNLVKTENLQPRQAINQLYQTNQMDELNILLSNTTANGRDMAIFNNSNGRQSGNAVANMIGNVHGNVTHGNVGDGNGYNTDDFTGSVDNSPSSSSSGMNSFSSPPPNNTQKEGWYLGKFLGVKRYSSSSNRHSSSSTAASSEASGVDRTGSTGISSAALHSQSPPREGWYPGKFLGKIQSSPPSSSNTNDIGSSTQVVDTRVVVRGEGDFKVVNNKVIIKDGVVIDAATTVDASDVSGAAFCLGRSLNPPFRTKKHSAVPASIAITIIACNNLKSPLKRIITRPINTVVGITVGGETKHTEVIQNSPNPIFDMKCIYTFQIAPDNVVGGFIEFTVLDKGLLDFAPMGLARLPFAALKTKLDNNDPTPIILPLLSTKPNIRSVGKNFYSSLPAMAIPSKQLPKKIDSPLSSPSQSTKGQNSPSKSAATSDLSPVHRSFTSDIPTLSIQVSKIDLLQHWMLEELRLRDDEREQQISQLHEEDKEVNVWVSQGSINTQVG